MINALNGFSKDWFLEVNQIKTKCLVFSKGTHQQIPGFTLGDRNLSFCDEYCYLGIMFSKSGSFKSASNALTDKATGAMFSLINNLYRYRSINPYVLCWIYLIKW